MKKRTLAVLIGAATLPVTAMAAPGFYGKLHLSLDRTSDYLSASVGDQITGGTPLTDAWFLESNSSRLGVKGSDALFNSDLKAIYQVEVGIDADGDGSTFSTRNTYLGLDTKAGKFFAGRYDSVIKQAQGNVDQFNDTAADMENIFYGERRLSNTLNWESPSYSGLVFKVQLAPGEGTTIGSAANTDLKDGAADTAGASVTFNQDALYVSIAAESSYIDSQTGDATDTQTLRGVVGANLDGGVQLGAIVEQVKLDYTGGGDADVMTYMVSGAVKAGDRLTLKAQYGKLDSSDLNSDASVVTAGADYMLGKQTKVYGLASMSDADLATTPAVNKNGNLISLGMVHSF